jgi:hypothetical protein
MLPPYANYFSRLFKVRASATHVNPEKMARGIASAVLNSGSRFEKMVLKNKTVENKATKTIKPNKIKESFFVNLVPAFHFQLRIKTLLGL